MREEESGRVFEDESTVQNQKHHTDNNGFDQAKRIDDRLFSEELGLVRN